ncbi:hypothetical protein TNCV_3519471 [Trichonephila clavipes]|uniref:Uncharacterized protein n=1 Tax=Trichonephila clavipes TaxID=2585209 RepID=A0A8X6SY22_TRICX|nr:hypothetical protein TNCV_3519471 [Trichonephila clavipes]
MFLLIEHCEEKPSGESIRLLMSEKKKSFTSNISRVGSTSVSPQEVREESVVPFEEENNRSGYSTHPCASKWQ